MINYNNEETIKNNGFNLVVRIIEQIHIHWNNSQKKVSHNHSKTINDGLIVKRKLHLGMVFYSNKCNIRKGLPESCMT